MANRIQYGLQAVAQEWEILSRFLRHWNLRDYYNFRHTNRHILHVTRSLPQRLPPIAPAALHNPRRAASLPSATASNNPQQASNASQRRTSLPSHSNAQAPAVPHPNLQPIHPLPNNLQPIAPPRHNGRPTGPLPEQIPLTIPPSLKKYLGRGCDDFIGPYNGRAVPLGPCPNSTPFGYASPCQGTNPTTHALPPPETHLVCSTCHRQNSTNRGAQIRISLMHRRALLCKKCSKRLNARFNQDRRAPRNSCTCRNNILGRWHCYGCMDEAEARILGRGLTESNRLLRTHIVKDKRTKRKSLVEKRVKGAAPGSALNRATRRSHA